MLGGKLCVLVLDKFLVFYSHAVQIYFTSFDLVSVFCSFFDSTGFWNSSWLHCTHKESTQHGNSIYDCRTGRFSTRRWGVPHQGPGLCMSEDAVFGQPCFWQHPFFISWGSASTYRTQRTFRLLHLHSSVQLPTPGWSARKHWILFVLSFIFLSLDQEVLISGGRNARGKITRLSFRQIFSVLWPGNLNLF